MIRNGVKLLLVFILLWTVVVSSTAQASKNARPFWTEKSAFVEGDDLFVVGVASNAKTLEDGRQEAFEHGKIELMNYAQITMLEAQGLVIETQMTFEEPSPGGGMNVFRLLRVPIAKLLAIQNNLQRLNQAQQQALRQRLQELEQGKRDLEAMQAVLREKEREAEALLGQLRPQIERTQAETEQLSPGGPVVEQLQQMTVQVKQRTCDVEEVIKAARERIAQQDEERKAMCERLLFGMTKGEVAAVIGEPTLQKAPNLLSYGPERRITIEFDDMREEVNFIYGCEWNELATRVEKTVTETSGLGTSEKGRGP